MEICCCHPHFPSSENGVGGQLPHGVGGVAALLGVSLELSGVALKRTSSAKYRSYDLGLCLDCLDCGGVSLGTSGGKKVTAFAESGVRMGTCRACFSDGGEGTSNKNLFLRTAPALRAVALTSPTL